MRCLLSGSLAILLCGVPSVAAPAAKKAAPPRVAKSVMRLDAKTRVTIVLANDATPPEHTAAQELQNYLKRITGATFSVVAEAKAPKSGKLIYLGPTQFARKALASTFKGEQWAMQTSGDKLILTGARPRGVLYATYHFLEDIAGVHWWNPWEEFVPARKVLAVPVLQRRGAPVFAYRDIYTIYGNDAGRFAARNRLNAQGDAPISGEFGGGRKYGPPYHVHTFNRYLPEEKYFAAHPEWFPLIKGQRTAGRTQLCLTNTAMRAEFLRLLQENIRATRAKAAANHEPPPDTFSVSQNDWGGWCECENCAALVAAQGSQSGPLFDFVNFLADGVKQEFPDVFLDTLAYQASEAPPKTIRPRDNIVIRLTDTTSDYLLPVTAERNKVTRDQVQRWGKIAKNLRIWDYAVTYTPPQGLPVPTVQTYAPDYRFFLQNNVEGIFTEHEYPILADTRDYKIWMMVKLLENPRADPQTLERVFTDGFYGAAGVHFRRYLQQLQAAARKTPSDVNWFPTLTQFKYLDLEFLRTAQKTFDQAAAAVADNPVLSRRVRHARLPLDRASLIFFPRLMKQWVYAGKKPEDLPLDRDGIAQRVRQTWHEQADLRIADGKQRDQEKAIADAEVARYSAGPIAFVLPEKFRALPMQDVFDFPASTMRNFKNVAQVVPDPEAESGLTNRLDFDIENLEKYKLPMPWGVYDKVEKKGIAGKPLAAQDVTGPGYHWYKIGTVPLNANSYAYFFWSWIIQVDLDDIPFDKRPADQKYDVWARVKFEGPAFPHGKATDKNAIFVERVTVTPAQ